LGKHSLIKTVLKIVVKSGFCYNYPIRLSQLFGKTTKTLPADAKIASHKLLYKGGFIRRISTGRWAFLPLGMRVWEKIYKVIDEEMRSIGCQKVVVPTFIR